MKHLMSSGIKFFASILTLFFVLGMILGNSSFAASVNAAYLTPRLIVTGSEITTGEVNAGDDFELLIHLKNESTTTKLNNIRIELTSENNEIIPVNGTNVIYIDSMEKEEERDVTIELSARGDLQQKPYTITLNYAYEDKDRNPFEDSSLVTIPVLQTPEIALSEFRITRQSVVVDGKTNVTFVLNNIGRDTVYNVSVEFSGENIDDISTYVGTLDVSTSGNVDMSLKASDVGNGVVTAHITFEDADGKEYSFDKTFDFEVTAQAQAAVAEAEVGNALPIPLIAAAVVAIVIIVIVVVNVIRKKKEKAYA